MIDSDIEELKDRLFEYLIYYNEIRTHQSLAALKLLLLSYKTVNELRNLYSPLPFLLHRI